MWKRNVEVRNANSAPIGPEYRTRSQKATIPREDDIHIVIVKVKIKNMIRRKGKQ